ncbi:MAG: hypothetical protein IPM35_03810 [Myxococcales bacterium]|nr:hypothetical protein [Myxococcales bacterium]
MRLWAQVTIALSVLLLQHRADAACNRPDLVFVVPPDGASAVPPNAKLFARYRSNAAYTGEDITLSGAGGEQVLSGEWSEAETLLSVTPVELLPGEQYSVEWPRLRGVNAGSLGKGASVEFTVGSALDEAPPEFEGLSGISWDVDRERDDCTDSLEDRYLFDLELGDASDDGGRESLMVVVFQTKGPNVDESAPEPIGVQRIPSPGSRLRVERTLGDGEGDVCFAAVARDLTGKVSASGAKEVCTETVAPPFFEGCSAAPRPPAGGAAALFALVLGALVCRRGRR